MFFKKKSDVNSVDLSRVPQHIGIIMDGNGRWARRRGLPRSAGHRAGADALENICDYCGSIGVKVLTVYAFSTENWKRPQKEVDALMKLLYDYLANVEKHAAKRNMKLRISGDTSPLTDKIKKAIIHAEDVTKDCTGLILNIALNYGGRDEIVRAVREAAKRCADGEISCDEIDENYLGRLMYTAGLPEVDLIIRPSGELRLSNFLLWQCAYAEFWFSDICWPDFKPADMERAICDYQRRDRRFGGVK